MAKIWPILSLPPNTMHFPKVSVGHKIIAGYGLALSLAIGGTLTGMFVGSYEQDKVWQRVPIAKQESVLLRHLHSEVSQVQIQQYNLLNYVEQPFELQAQLAQLELTESKIAPAWANLQVFAVNHHQVTSQYGQEFRQQLIKLNNHLVTRYFYELRLFSRQLKSSGSLTLEQRRILTSEFINSPTSKAFGKMLATLTQQEELAAQAVFETQQEMRGTSQKTMNLILGTLLGSTLLAAILGWLISRTIATALGNVEYVAKSVIATGNFQQRCPIQTQDEIGSLATSLNQLITWVESRTQALEDNRDLLEVMIAMQTKELKAIIDYLGDGLLVCNGQTGQISRCNPAFEQMFGLQSADIIGKLPENVLGADLVNLIQQHRVEPHPIAAEVQLCDRRLGQALISPILSETYGATQLEGAVILVRDVTHDREIEQMKTDFLSTVSHELRTPLTSVIGFAKLIQKKLEEVVFPIVPLEGRKVEKSVHQVRENLTIIISEGDRLTSLINDVLDVAKIEAGKVEWHMAATEISEIVNQAVAATSVLAQNSNLQVKIELSSELPQVFVDRDRIIQVLINLFSNAIKFTDEGDVTCQVELQDQMLLVRVIDTGAGLAPEDLELVFEKFKQVGEVMTNKPKGTGLGLPICKQIIEHHQGEIWAESLLGQGSTFCFTVPIVVEFTTQDRSKIHSETILNNRVSLNQLVQQTVEQDCVVSTVKTILVVDDEPCIRQLLRQELESQNYCVEEAGDGIEALNVVRRNPPDLIILDVMMPKMNGLDLAAILKNNPETSMIPIIILSIMEEQAKGYRLGVDRYQSKPININILFQDIALLLQQATSNHRVLTVDGEVVTINALLAVLLERGYAPIALWDGQTGIDVAMANQQHMVIFDSGIPTTPLEQHDPTVKTFRLDNGEGSIFFVLRSRLGVNLPDVTMLPVLALPELIG